tara:strand:- start:11525 stop:11698 length:174 start_codon:yes stop_codon:yes gene_type:complete
MDKEEIVEIIEMLKSKEIDCKNFLDKYKKREMEDLAQYYDGALWALKYTLSLLEEKK